MKQYKHVMEILSACRFSLKSANNLNRPTVATSEVSLFRNLFFPCPEEIAEFERLLEGDIYTLLMKAIGTDMDRDEFKGEFFHFLYRPAFSCYNRVHQDDGTVEKVEEPIRKAFETLLPSIVLFLDLCKCQPGTLNPKGVYYKWISRAMISVESQMMLECCATL